MNLFARKFRVGVDLGSTHIKIAGVRYKQRKYELEFFDVIDLAHEFSLSDRDRINDEIYIKSLQKLVEKYRLRNSWVHATLPADKALIQNLIFPISISDAEITAKIEEEFQQLTTEQISDMQIVFQKMHNKSPNEGDNQLSVLACGLPFTVKEKYLRILRDSRLNVSVLALDAFSIYNAIHHYCGDLLAKPISVVHIGADYSICLQAAHGKNPFFKIIKIGGNYLTERLMEESRLNFFKAEAFKKRMYRPEKTRMDAYQKSNLSEIFSGFANRLIPEVKRSILHFQSKEGLAEMDKLFLSGGGAQIDLIKEAFSEKLHIPTQIWNPLEMFDQDNLQTYAEAQLKQGSLLTPTIGTLLRGD